MNGYCMRSGAERATLHNFPASPGFHTFLIRRYSQDDSSSEFVAVLQN